MILRTWVVLPACFYHWNVFGSLLTFPVTAQVCEWAAHANMRWKIWLYNFSFKTLNSHLWNTKVKLNFSQFICTVELQRKLNTDVMVRPPGLSLVLSQSNTCAHHAASQQKTHTCSPQQTFCFLVDTKTLQGAPKDFSHQSMWIIYEFFSHSFKYQYELLHFSFVHPWDWYSWE